MPLTEKGFERQTFEELVEVQIKRAKLILGEDMETSENSTFGKILRLQCISYAELLELAEQIYLSAFPNTAKGVSLDRLCKLVGLQRNSATHAEHQIVVNGEPGTIIEMGFLVAAGDVVFHTVNYYEIGTGGTVAVTVECNNAGSIGNVPVGIINKIVNPVTGVAGITHTGVLKFAVEKETDYELRKRFSQAQSQGSGTLDSIRGAVLRVPSVESVYIEENPTSMAIGRLPAHSFRCFVHAPTTARQAVAEAIFSKKPVGISAAGSESVEVQDISGNPHTVKFSWTEEVRVYIKCRISVDSSFSAADIQVVKNNLVSKLSGYRNGQDVTATSLYAAIYDVDSIADVTSLTISSDGVNYDGRAIKIDNAQVARTSDASIEVTVNE